MRVDHNTLRALKYWTWQFVKLRPVCSVQMILLELVGIYPTWLDWTITMILNISVSMALYALVLFYHIFAKELAPHKPLAKFMCVKGIVFFCFWQVTFLLHKLHNITRQYMHTSFTCFWLFLLSCIFFFFFLLLLLLLFSWGYESWTAVALQSGKVILKSYLIVRDLKWIQWLIFCKRFLNLYWRKERTNCTKFIAY